MVQFQENVQTDGKIDRQKDIWIDPFSQNPSGLPGDPTRETMKEVPDQT